MGQLSSKSNNRRSNRQAKKRRDRIFKLFMIILVEAPRVLTGWMAIAEKLPAAVEIISEQMTNVRHTQIQHQAPLDPSSPSSHDDTPNKLDSAEQ